MAERFRQLRVARLQLLEEPHVLDGDHCLIGEGLQQRDLLVAERPHFRPPDDDHADGGVLARERCREDGAKALGARAPGAVRILAAGGLRLDVGDVERPPLQDGAPGDAARRDRTPAVLAVRDERKLTGVRHTAQDVALDQENERVLAAAHPNRVPGHGVEHGLHVRR